MEPLKQHISERTYLIEEVLCSLFLPHQSIITNPHQEAVSSYGHGVVRGLNDAFTGNKKKRFSPFHLHPII